MKHWTLDDIAWDRFDRSKLDPELESRETLDRLAATMYGDFSWKNLHARFLYATTPGEKIKRWDPEWAAKEEKKALMRRERR